MRFFRKKILKSITDDPTNTDLVDDLKPVEIRMHAVRKKIKAMEESGQTCK